MKKTETVLTDTVDGSLGHATVEVEVPDPPQVLDGVALAVALVAAPDDGQRPALGCVFVKDRWAFAADGFAAARVDLPALAGDNVPPGAARADGPVLIPGRAAAWAAKSALPHFPSKDGRGVAWVTGPDADGERLFTWRHKRGANVSIPCRTDAAFPEERIERVIAEAEAREAKTVTLNTQLVLRVARLFDRFYAGSRDDGERMQWHVPAEKSQPVMVTGVRRDGRRLMVVVMPMVEPGDRSWARAEETATSGAE